jgi:hypothetical protein
MFGFYLLILGLLLPVIQSKSAQSITHNMYCIRKRENTNSFFIFLLFCIATAEIYILLFVTFYVFVFFGVKIE